jgi:hypothetical protein
LVAILSAVLGCGGGTTASTRSQALRVVHDADTIVGCRETVVPTRSRRRAAPQLAETWLTGAFPGAQPISRPHFRRETAVFWLHNRKRPAGEAGRFWGYYREESGSYGQSARFKENPATAGFFLPPLCIRI